MKVLNSSVGSKKGKHTDFAKWTSVMRKLNNSIENSKVNEKRNLKNQNKTIDK